MALRKLVLIAAMREVRISPKRSSTGMPMPRARSPSTISIMLTVSALPLPWGLTSKSPFSETSK